MGFFSRFEGKVEDAMEGAAGRMSDAPISPVQISKKAEKAMRREKMVGAGKQYAPTLYTVLVNVDDDRRLFGMYPTLAGEIETFLTAKAMDNGLVMDGQPLVRFIADESLRHGKFDIIAEPVAAPIIEQLRMEEMERYGIIQNQSYGRSAYDQAPASQPPVHDPYAPNDIPYLMEDIPMDPQPTPAPAPQVSYARLVDRKSNQTYPLKGNRVMIGRGADCNISISDINCSRHHALLTQEPNGAWIISDQGSTNGTIVNGRVITTPEPLYEGSQITLGLTTLTFTMA